MRRCPTREVLVLASLAALLGVGACSKMHIIPNTVQNQLPIVRITAAPIDSNATCTPDPARSCYSLTLMWTGYDPDGRVDHYLYAVDPPASPDTVWQTSHGNQERLVFPSGHGTPTLPHHVPVARDYHVFVIKAVDDKGQPGPPTMRAFFSYTLAPDVIIIDPIPTSLSIPLLVPSVRIRWAGTDDDGVFHDKPVKYKYILLTSQSPFPVDSAVAYPERILPRFAPDFAGWDSVSGDTTVVQYTNLAPDAIYMFMVVAFDEAGAYSPIFNMNHSMLRFKIGYAGVLGPKITIFNEFFNYTNRGEYCPTCPAPAFVEVPAGRPVSFNWTANRTAGTDIRCFRWAVDIEDVHDETPRSNETTDLRHWSTCGLTLTGCTIGPFAGTLAPDPPEEHRLYLECQDNVGMRSIVIVRFQVVRSNPVPGSTLIVKDTRFKGDDVDRSTGCATIPPAGVVWPTQAELDTFLFARGGVPWRCTTPPSTSVPGLFAGYSFDTIGTKVQGTDLTVRLSKLVRYDHIIWIVDAKGAGIDDGTNNPLGNRATSLRFMTAAGRFNTLGAFVKQGGKVWVVGGGGAYASTIEWNNANNDGEGHEFSAVLNELVPGRFMYDLARWQSAFRVNSVLGNIQRYTGRFEQRPEPGTWADHLGELPARMEYKTAATDPMPPNRTRTTDYYKNTATLEFLTLANPVVENLSGDPLHPRETSTLDTLYSNGGVPFGGGDRNILMTYYHGGVVPQGFLFSGFDIWIYKRAQCQALVDFVMKRMWGLGSTAPLAARH